MTHNVELVGTWSQSDIAYANGKRGLSNADADRHCGFAIRNLPETNVALVTSQSVNRGIDAPVMFAADNAPIVEVKRSKGTKRFRVTGSKVVKPSAAFLAVVAKHANRDLVERPVKQSAKLASELEAIEGVKHIASIEAKALRDQTPATPKLGGELTTVIQAQSIAKRTGNKGVFSNGKAGALRGMVSNAQMIAERATVTRAARIAFDRQSRPVAEQIAAMRRKHVELTANIAKKQAAGKDATSIIKCREVLESHIHTLVVYGEEKGLFLVKPIAPKDAIGTLIDFTA